MATKKKSASVLLKALGKNKKEQMKTLYPGMSTATKPKKPPPKIPKSKNVSKGSYTRGKVMGSGDDKFLSRRAVMAGVKPSVTNKDRREALGEVAKTGLALATGYSVAKLGSKYSDNKKAQAAKGAKDLIKKQKEQKERNKRKKHHS